MYRQGDLLIKPISELPEERLVKSFVEDNQVVLLHGEATGHNHTLKGNFSLLRNNDGVAYLDVHEDCVLVHDEHATIDVVVGKYAVIRQREYTPEKIVYVRD